MEQADAALIVMPNGKTLLIDSGNNGQGQRLRNAMIGAGVIQIDAFVNTHYHEDHYGGIDELVGMGVPVLDAFDRGDKDCCLSAAKRSERSFQDYQRAVGTRAHGLRPGDTITLDPLVTITCISSGGDVIGATQPVLGRDENDMSVSLLIEFMGFKAFYGGDLQAPTEGQIASRDLVSHVDLYKADHHGSDTSSLPQFMLDLMPSLIVISNGSNGAYNHPRQSTLNAYATLNPAAVVLQTNKCFRPAPCGNVPDALIADPETVDDDGTIEIDVDAASRTYSARYGMGAILLRFTADAVDIPVQYRALP